MKLPGGKGEGENRDAAVTGTLYTVTTELGLDNDRINTNPAFNENSVLQLQANNVS